MSVMNGHVIGERSSSITDPCNDWLLNTYRSDVWSMLNEYEFLDKPNLTQQALSKYFL